MLSITIRTAAAAAVLVVATAAFAQTAPDALGRIKNSKQINVAYSGDSLPFSVVGPGDEPVGYSIDLCKRVIAQVSRATGVSDLKVNWRIGTAGERVAMIASGKADLDCANTTATLTRMKDVDFSSLIFIDSGGFLVKAGAPIQRFTDLAGKRIGVIKGTTTETRLEGALKARLVNAQVVKLSDGNEGTAMLLTGSLDAYASDKVKLIGLAAQSKDPSALALLAEDLSFEPLAFALPRGDSAFRLEVNRALSQIYASGEIEEIFMKWLGKLGRPTGLLAAMYLLNVTPQ
jgi:ABC-type amino acid transport substrate-binding protein